MSNKRLAAMTDEQRQTEAISHMRVALDAAMHNYLVDMGGGPNDQLTAVLRQYFAAKAIALAGEVINEVREELAKKKAAYEAELRYSGLLPPLEESSDVVPSADSVPSISQPE